MNKLKDKDRKGAIIYYSERGEIFGDFYKKYEKVIRLGVIALACFTLWLWYGIFATARAESALYFLDIGQGDAQLLVIKAPGKESGTVKILVDAGRGSRVLTALDDALGGQDDKYIDIILATHQHEDHYAGFIEVAKNYEVGLFVHNGLPPEDAEVMNWQVLIDELKARDIRDIALGEGDVISYDANKLSVLSPDNGLLSAGDANEASIVIMAEVYASSEKDNETIRVLFTGDIGLSTEDVLLAKSYDLSADILKVGHHGSGNSTSVNFIYAVRPAISGIGVGENRYGHPTSRVLEVLETAGSLVYATKDNGTVKVPLDRTSKNLAKGSDAGMFANIWGVMSGSYHDPRVTTVTLADAEERDVEFSLVKYNACKFDKPTGRISSPVRINEVAWMGATTGATHEWVELRKMSSEKINITGWQLLNANENLRATFPQGSFFDDEFIILARAPADSALNLNAGLTFSGAIRNSGEGLRLFDNECNIIDEVFASPNWPAGANASKHTMERVGKVAWASSKGANGTPGMANAGTISGSTPVVKTVQKDTVDTGVSKVEQSISSCVDINSADIKELARITGIGPTYAQRIIEYRDRQKFKTVEELDNIKGIGPATITKIKTQALACIKAPK